MCCFFIPCAVSDFLSSVYLFPFRLLLIANLATCLSFSVTGHLSRSIVRRLLLYSVLLPSLQVSYVLSPISSRLSVLSNYYCCPTNSFCLLAAVPSGLISPTNTFSCHYFLFLSHPISTVLSLCLELFWSSPVARRLLPPSSVPTSRNSPSPTHPTKSTEFLTSCLLSVCLRINTFQRVHNPEQRGKLRWAGLGKFSYTYTLTDGFDTQPPRVDAVSDASDS